MKISVVTTVWNRSEQAKWGLSSLLKQENPPDQLVIVDDGSEDNLASAIIDLREINRAVDIDYVFLNHPEARISSFPRNVGLRHAKHELVFFTEPEMLHVGPTLLQMRFELEKEPDHIPMAGQIWTMGQRIWKSFAQNETHYLNDPKLILTHQYAQLTDSSNMHNTKAPDSDWGITGSNNCFAGCFFGGYTRDFLKVRGFEETFTGHGYDDWDLLERLSLYGRPHKMHNDIVVIHQWHEKNYPYNIYDHAEKNGTQSKERIANGQYGANQGNDKWGLA